jgi:hypothetical protein
VSAGTELHGLACEDLDDPSHGGGSDSEDSEPAREARLGPDGSGAGCGGPDGAPPMQNPGGGGGGGGEEGGEGHGDSDSGGRRRGESGRRRRRRRLVYCACGDGTVKAWAVP